MKVPLGPKFLLLLLRPSGIVLAFVLLLFLASEIPVMESGFLGVGATTGRGGDGVNFRGVGVFEFVPVMAFLLVATLLEFTLVGT